MCPVSEAQRRTDECDVHVLELPERGGAFIKKFQRSSADHELQTPHLMRTPAALLMTTTYIETHIMSQVQPAAPRLMYQHQQQGAGVAEGANILSASTCIRSSLDNYSTLLGASTNIVIYLFIWDRFRMVAKDFTLQQQAVSFSPLWIECHQRMARWFVLMDHRMKGDGKCNYLVTVITTMMSWF